MAKEKANDLGLDEDLQQEKANQTMVEFHNAKNENHFEGMMVKKVYDGVEFEELNHIQPVDAGFRTCYYAPFCQETTYEDGIRCDRDMEAVISGGRKIYMDVYRPEEQLENLPVVVVWTPYGKRHWHGKDVTPGLHQAIDVPRGTISKRAAFESPDPGWLCHEGYCVVNVDAPGCGHSEGDNTFFFTEEGGQDGREVIDWIGEQSWCNGNVGMSGNSAIAISQWVVAAAKPKHLKCIAPWEGTNDLYRETLANGGILFTQFAEMIWWDFRGSGLQPDLSYMIQKYPLYNEYWENHRVKLENIKVPAYICAGWQHPYHLRGTLNGFRSIKSRSKWLRIHQEFEWADFNRPEYRAEVLRFFDRYLKNINNGWELTPKVRVEVMDGYDHDASYCKNRTEVDFPIPRTQYTKFYLNAADTSMSLELVEKESTISYNSLTEEVNFDFDVTEEMELTGYFVLRLWISSETDDADVFIYIRKMNEDGNFIPTIVLGSEDPGARGQLRASMRALDEEKSLPYFPQYKYTKKEPLTPGEPVAMDIEIWPHGRIWHKGEKLRVSIAGRPIYPKTWYVPTDVLSDNKGKHTLHTGGKYDSHLLAPVIPPKYKAGEYEKRT